MKKIIILAALMISNMAFASELVCNGSTFDEKTGVRQSNDIKITKTDTIFSSNESGTVFFGDLQLNVSRNLTSDITALIISKKNNSETTPFLKLGLSQAWKLTAGQLHLLELQVGDLSVGIVCSLK